MGIRKIKPEDLEKLNHIRLSGDLPYKDKHSVKKYAPKGANAYTVRRSELSGIWYMNFYSIQNEDS